MTAAVIARCTTAQSWAGGTQPMSRRRLRRLPRRPSERSSPCQSVGFWGCPEQLREGFDLRVGGLGLSAFNALQTRGRYSCGGSQRRLGQPNEHPPVPGVALIHRHLNDALDRMSEDLHHRSQFVDLRGESSCLPRINGRRRYARQACQIRHRHGGLPQPLEALPIESAQNATTHASTSRLTALNHHAHLPRDVNPVGIDSESIPDYSTCRCMAESRKRRCGVNPATKQSWAGRPDAGAAEGAAPTGTDIARLHDER